MAQQFTTSTIINSIDSLILIYKNRECFLKKNGFKKINVFYISAVYIFANYYSKLVFNKNIDYAYKQEIKKLKNSYLSKINKEVGSYMKVKLFIYRYAPILLILKN